MTGAVLLAEVRRGELVESRHFGYVVLLDPDGHVEATLGAMDRCYPRSAVKPAQAAALVRLGFSGPAHHLALAASSHHGEPGHLAGVTEILSGAGLAASALQNPAELPLDPTAAAQWLAAGRDPAPIAMNCSGKHAAMLATCVINGWPTENYREPSHPLQVQIRAEIATRAAARPEPLTVDGCGAPLFGLPLVALARLVRAVALAPEGDPARAVVAAMRSEPWYVGGSTSDVTRLMRAVPGLVAKNGAEGVAAAALPDGRALAIKIADGSDRARRVVLAALLTGWGVGGAAVAESSSLPVLGGPTAVGSVRSSALLDELGRRRLA